VSTLPMNARVLSQCRAAVRARAKGCGTVQLRVRGLVRFARMAHYSSDRQAKRDEYEVADGQGS
jgi:hypothetical protein